MSLSNLALKSGRIYICDEIKDSIAEEFLYKTDYCISRKIQDIKIFINTDGGDIPAALAISDRISMMKNMGLNVMTVGLGQVLSAGIFILEEGTKRYAYPNTTFMIHPFVHTLEADYQMFMKQYNKFHDSFYNNLMFDLANKCGKTTPKEIQRFIEKANDSIWLNVEEAIEFNLIDDVWTTELEVK